MNEMPPLYEEIYKIVKIRWIAIRTCLECFIIFRRVFPIVYSKFLIRKNQCKYKIEYVNNRWQYLNRKNAKLLLAAEFLMNKKGNQFWKMENH